MVSKNTNVSAYVALGALRDTDASLYKSEARVSSGYKVATAADDAAYWSIATTMRSDNRSLKAVEDALSMAAGVLDTAFQGMSASTDIMSNMKARLVMARESGVDRDKINTELTAMKEQLRSIAESSTFSGENWLQKTSNNDLGTRSLVSSFQRDNSGYVQVDTIDYDIDGQSGTTSLNYLVDDKDGDDGILTSNSYATAIGASKNWVVFNGTAAGTGYDEISLSTTTTTQELDDMIKVVDAMNERMTVVASDLGAKANRVETQHEFALDLQNAIKTGVGNMVDTNLDEESSRLRALQAQQQLGTTALSIVNTQVQSLLQLM
ncbi:flagellin N-terminal helical domain-containing protein [Allorhizobium undicola]|uniref:flagellin N-terminal helical domain-containing protein n=1 Tax=Allorhizobium undicola TaxID=78527 RepID=UPI000485E737|nr:flagellin [Allorhizobium undicola]